MAKLKDLLSEVLDETPKVNKYKVIEGVASYGILGKKIYGENNVVKIAEALVQIAESAHSHIIGEQGDWFDKVTVNKNMKALKSQVAEFKTVAREASSVNQRLTSLYEDMGHILNRYYDINEEDKGDMDNDGKSEPDDKEYLQNKRAAITKAVKSEQVQKAMKETWDNFKKRPTKRLSDIKNSVVSEKSIGYYKKIK